MISAVSFILHLAVLHVNIKCRFFLKVFFASACLFSKKKFISHISKRCFGILPFPVLFADARRDIFHFAALGQHGI